MISRLPGMVLALLVLGMGMYLQMNPAFAMVVGVLLAAVAWGIWQKKFLPANMSELFTMLGLSSIALFAGSIASIYTIFVGSFMVGSYVIDTTLPQMVGILALVFMLVEFATSKN